MWEDEFDVIDDYTGRCGNCHSVLEDGDKYCRCCGTKRGEGAFSPHRNMIQCIYGPAPVRRTRRCTQCSFTWETYLMIDDEDYCPQCGAASRIVENEVPHDPFEF